MSSRQSDAAPVVLATTWNQNESGRLWERLWARDSVGFYSQLVCSGVFVGPWRYATEGAFWADYRQEQAQFFGRRAESR